MIVRFFATLFLIWALGFMGFVATLPQPAGKVQTDAVVVLTGGAGRIPHGLEVLEQGQADQLLVTGVDPEVTPNEFAAEYGVSRRRMRCCVTLGFTATDTRGNARETAEWVAEHDISTLRLVTTDWHMRRAASEITRTLPANVTVIRDAVPSGIKITTLFVEYNKLLASWLAAQINW
ncbi:YdcF family protein [Erythrobacteraceae bacterium E2-1 Yellow Sea]|nr:YdcF family protein [Erythrobacteraceae bacterium E2-1 Yellow Sea]